MYRPLAYAIDDVEVLHATVRARRFATIAAVVDERVQIAYGPVVLDASHGPKGGVRFHLARGNPLATAAVARLHFSFLGPDSYISPDWYEARQFVPTWNYIAVEAEGLARKLDHTGLKQLLVDLSAQEEARLSPKPPWTLDKLPEDRVTALLKAIIGYEVRFETLEGKFKLSQDKTAADFESLLMALERRSDVASAAVAAAMRRHGKRQA